MANRPPPSVDALYEKANNNAGRPIKALNAFVHANEPLDFSVLFGNRSYNTGLDCADTRPMQHFNIFTASRS